MSNMMPTDTYLGGMFHFIQGVGSGSYLVQDSPVQGEKLPAATALHSWSSTVPCYTANSWCSIPPSLPPLTPLFSYPTPSGQVVLTQAVFSRCLCAVLGDLGYDASLYTCHSLRRGGASFLFECGLPGELIQVIGDWKWQLQTLSGSVSCEQICLPEGDTTSPTNLLIHYFGSRPQYPLLCVFYNAVDHTFLVLLASWPFICSNLVLRLSFNHSSQMWAVVAWGQGPPGPPSHQQAAIMLVWG